MKRLLILLGILFALPAFGQGSCLAIIARHIRADSWRPHLFGSECDNQLVQLPGERRALHQQGYNIYGYYARNALLDIYSSHAFGF